MRPSSATLTFVAALLFASPTPAQNDECATAVPLGTGSVIFDTSLATPSPEPWPCAGGGGPDLWYAYTATSTDPVRFDTCSQFSYDTALEALTGDCGSLVSLACNDDACSLSSAITVVPASAGDVIFVRVGGFTGAAGPGVLSARELVPAPNDECAGATAIGLGASPFQTLGSTPSSTPWTCTPPSSAPDTWYEYTAASDRALRVSLASTTPLTRIEAYSGDCGGLVSLGCAVLDASVPGALIVTPMGAGQSLRLRIGDVLGLDANGTITIEELDPASNDECTGALPLFEGAATPFETFTATPSSGAFSCLSGTGPDVWFSYVPMDSNVTLVAETCGSSFDTVLEAYGGSCGTLVSLGCSDDAALCGVFTQSRVSIPNPAAGQTVWFRVGGASGSTGDGEILIEEMPAPVQGCLTNPGFETGDLAGWSVTDFATPFVPATVAPAGQDPGFGLPVSEPTEGSFSLIHGFDADGPDTLVVSQVVTVDPLLTPFTFDWRAGWDLDDFPGSTQDRTFDVVVRDVGTDAELARINVLTAAAGTAVVDTGATREVIDLTAFVGQTVRLGFEWFVPESFTGPATFELDNVLCPAEGGAIGINYCSPGNANSTGVGGRIDAFGSGVAAANMVTLVARDLPANAFGFFLVSRARGFVFNPGGSFGNLCLGGDIGRYVGPGEIQNSGPSGEFMLGLDLTSVPQSTGPVSVLAGESWNFQGWFRDSINGVAVSNLTDGTTIDFL